MKCNHKKPIGLLSIIVFVLILSGCGKTDSNQSKIAMEKLQELGYVADSIADYGNGRWIVMFSAVESLNKKDVNAIVESLCDSLGTQPDRILLVLSIENTVSYIYPYENPMYGVYPNADKIDSFVVWTNNDGLQHSGHYVEDLDEESKPENKKYKDLLLKLQEESCLPNGIEVAESVDTITYFYRIADFDNDGREELLLINIAGRGAPELTMIYEVDSEGNVITEYCGSLNTTFFDNGMIRDEQSHNQSPNVQGDIWPFQLYRYAAEKDIYEKVGNISAVNVEEQVGYRIEGPEKEQEVYKTRKEYDEWMDSSLGKANILLYELKPFYVYSKLEPEG